MLLELIKLPLRLAAIPALLALLALQLLGVILIGLSSVVTHLLASVFLLGAVAVDDDRLGQNIAQLAAARPVFFNDFD